LPKIEVNIPMSDESSLTINSLATDSTISDSTISTDSTITDLTPTNTTSSKSDSESKIDLDAQIYADKNKELVDPNKDIYNGILKEIIILNKIKYVIDSNICPNFVYFHYSNILIQKLLIDGKLSYDIDSINIYKLNLVNLYTVMEYCDGTLIDFFNEEYDINIYKSFVFQICCAILCLQKHIGIKHNDISATNIMFIKINENIVLNYKINNINYFVPTYGFLFVIVDFDKSQFITKENNKLNSDFKYLQKLYQRPLKTILRKNNIITSMDLLEILNINSINDVFDMLKINEESYDYYYPKNIEILTSELYSKIFYSAVNNNLIDFKKYYSDKTEKIVKLLKHYTTNIFMSKDNIEILIKNNFADFLIKPDNTDANIISFVL
jgi:hypothetical protein